MGHKFSMPRPSLSSNRGNTMVVALLLVVIVGIASFAIPQMETTQQKHLRTLRIRALMTNVEVRLREFALSPNTYQSCDSSAGVTSCRIHQSKLTSISTLRVFGAECPPSLPNCGIRFVPGPDFPRLKLSASGAQFEGTLIYEGDDLKLAPIPINVQVPLDLVQSKAVSCAQIDASRPIFHGFDSQGRAKCRALPAPCGPGQYLYAVNPRTLASQCRNLSPALLECPAGQMIGRVSYLNGEFSTQCIERLDPFQTIPSPDLTP